MILKATLRPSITWLTAGLVLLAACEREPDRFSVQWLTDNDTQILDLHEPGKRLVGTADLEIGRVEGGGPQVFTRIGGLAVDRAGRIVVADQMSDEVRVFSEDGAYEFSFGRTGAGPGEFRSPCCLAWGDDGLLWVRDGGNARYNAYELESSSARYVRTVRSLGDGGTVPLPLTFSDGRIVDFTTSWGELGPEYTRHEIDTTGQPVRSTRITPPADRIPHATYGKRPRAGLVFALYGPRHEIAHSPSGEWAEVVTSDYLVLWRHADGRILRVIRRDLGPPTELTREERERERTRALDFQGVDVPLTRLRPRIRDLFFDQQGRLWIQLQGTGSRCHADVIDTDGSYHASVQWPCRVDLSRGYIAEVSALGVARGQWSEDNIVRIRFDTVDSPSS